MNTSKRQRAWTIVLCVALAATGCAEVSTPAPPAPTTASTAAAPPLPSGTLGATLVTATARVKALDQQTRQVTLARADGSEVTLYADDTVRNLPQVRVGDEVTASYYESLAYEVKKPGTATPGATRGRGSGPCQARREARRGRGPGHDHRSHHHRHRQGRGHRHAAGADRAGDDDQGTRPAQPRSRGRG